MPYISFLSHTVATELIPPTKLSADNQKCLNIVQFSNSQWCGRQGSWQEPELLQKVRQLPHPLVETLMLFPLNLNVVLSGNKLTPTHRPQMIQLKTSQLILLIISTRSGSGFHLTLGMAFWLLKYLGWMFLACVYFCLNTK